MDYGTFNGLYTLFIMVIFVGIVVWAYSKRRRKAFKEAANLVFADEVQQSNSKAGESQSEPSQSQGEKQS